VVGKATAEHRGRALGVANLGVPVGGLTFALVVGLVMDAWDWRAALQASAAIVFAAAVPAIAIGIPRDLGQVEDGPALTGSEDSLWTPRRLFRSPVFGLCALILGLGMGTSAGWVAHVAPYLSDLGATTRYAGLLLGSTQGFMIIGTLWLGAMVDRRSSVSILLGVFTVQMGCFALLLSQPGLQMVSIIMLGFGVASGGFLPVFGHLLAERFGTASLGRTMGLANIGLLPFGFGLPMVAGALRDARGNYDAVLLVCMCLFLTGVGALLLLSRQLQSEPAD
jgi:cyanate permease